MPSYVVYEWLRQLSRDANNTVVGIARSVGPVKEKLKTDNINNVSVLSGDMVDHKELSKAALATGKITNDVVDYLIVNGAYSNPETKNLTPTGFIGREDVLQKDMSTSLNVNVLGVIFSINAFLPLVRKGSVKKIIVISTGLADPEAVLGSANPLFLAYSAMKAALNMIVVKYAVELKNEGITVLALSPGLVNTQETPPTEEDIKTATAMVQSLKQRYPHFKGLLEPSESVEAQRQVIEKIGTEDTGHFLSHWGNKQWI